MLKVEKKIKEGKMNIELNENERIDDLQYKNLKIIQNKDWFCFGLDSVILSDFAKKIKSGSNVLDLGTGNGILGLLLCAKTELNKIIGIEIQKDVCELAKRNIKYNELEYRFEIVNEDLKNLGKIYKENSFDVIVTNPPYMKNGSGAKNDTETKIIARHEMKCNLEDVIKISNKMLKNKGEFYMVHRANRICDILYLMRKYKIEPKNIRFVQPKSDKEPKLVLIKGIKNAGDFLKIEKNLIIYKEDGSYTDEILEIYNMKGIKDEG